MKNATPALTAHRFLAELAREDGITRQGATKRAVRGVYLPISVVWSKNNVTDGKTITAWARREDITKAASS